MGLAGFVSAAEGAPPPLSVVLRTAGRDRRRGSGSEGGSRCSSVLWNTATGAADLILEGHTDEVTDASFGPQGDEVCPPESPADCQLTGLIATASRDGTVRLWDGVAGKCTATLGDAADDGGEPVAENKEEDEHLSPPAVTSVHAHPEGSRVVSGAEDGAVTVWDSASHEQLMALDATAESTQPQIVVEAAALAAGAQITAGGAVIPTPRVEGDEWLTVVAVSLGALPSVLLARTLVAEEPAKPPGRVYEIHGCGLTEYNGKYITDGLNDGEDSCRYRKPGTDCTLQGPCGWRGGTWGLAKDYDYWLESSAAVPPASGWRVDKGGPAGGAGQEPAPSVELQPMPVECQNCREQSLPRQLKVALQHIPAGAAVAIVTGADLKKNVRDILRDSSNENAEPAAGGQSNAGNLSAAGDKSSGSSGSGAESAADHSSPGTICTVCGKTELPEVHFKQLRGRTMSSTQLKADGTVEFTGFETVGAPDAGVDSGRVFYEMEIVRMGPAPQMGWATGSFRQMLGSSTGEGVGDDPHSWGIDGHRRKKWHAGSERWGQAWSTGDVIGCAADLDTGELLFGRNGSWDSPMGAAFTGIGMSDMKGLYPALTASGGTFQVNLGEREWTHGLPPGERVFEPVASRVSYCTALHARPRLPQKRSRPHGLWSAATAEFWLSRPKMV